jgi:hypothetical protein
MNLFVWAIAFVGVLNHQLLELMLISHSSHNSPRGSHA